ncbi:MAG: 16S rRNA (adenine(1518)-N(6)/adenine(1519)-N(6))-dimethyltransferase RsmA [Candidatus Micrarchaeota archaeon]
MQLKKSLGQNFLRDENILRKEAALANVAGKTVLEIGPGDGRLTEKLLEQKPKKLICVEKDLRFVQLLEEKFAAAKNIQIVNADFLDYELPSVDIVIGNIPYYISSDIIFKLKDEKIETAIIMVQKEFAEKMVAKPNAANYGRLSVTSQLFFHVQLAFKVSRHLFTPRPKVDSAVIVLKPTGIELTAAQEDLIRKMYQQKNKKVRNSLRDVGAKWAERRPRTLNAVEVLEIIKNYSENSSAS